jgi:hypothetical protein
MPATQTYTINLGRRGVLCVSAYSDLRGRAVRSADAYASAPDGGHPWTDAARNYRAEQDAVFAEAARRTRAILATAFGMPS